MMSGSAEPAIFVATLPASLTGALGCEVSCVKPPAAGVVPPMAGGVA